MEVKIIVTVVVVSGIIIASGFRGVLHKIITGGQAIAVSLVWIGSKPALSISLLLLFIAGLLTFVYGLKRKAADRFRNISVMLAGILFIIGTGFKVLHLPGAGYAELLWILPFISVLISAVKDKRVYTQEMSFMLFWCVYGVLQFIALWT